MSVTAEERLTQIWETPHTVHGWLSTVDHKKIGKRYLVTAFVFLIVGGLEALVMRLQLARPDSGLIDPETYDQLFTMHSTTMMWWYAYPILAGFGNYFIPLLIGARDMAFPRLNAFSYWAFLLSGVFLYGSTTIFQAPHGGWFAYTPYTNAQYSPGYGMDFFALALIFNTISTTVGAINFIVTIFRLRAPGMAVSRMPLFLYSTLTVSFSIIFSLPALTVACVFLELDRRWQFHFFDVTNGGLALLWQQLFWFFGHPWVYIIAVFIIGGLNGIITAVIPVDWHLHDTYFVVAHLHYVLVGTNMLPVFAAFYYWLPKVTGRMMSEALGKVSFWFIFVGLNVAFFPMHILGIIGMPRRQWTYPAGLGWGSLNMMATIGAFAIAFGIALSIWNFFVSLRVGRLAGHNPWNADTLEWDVPSPPPPYGSVHIPTVVSRHPLWDDHEEEEDPRDERILDQGRLTLATTPLDGRLFGIARMPEDTVTPLLANLALTLIFVALILKSLWVALGGFVVLVVISGIWLWPERDQMQVGESTA